MAWFLVIMSALGILAGFVGEVRAAIVLFGIAFMALTYQNSKITWKWLGAMSDGSYVVDHKLTSGVVTFVVMIAIYLVVAEKLGIAIFTVLCYELWNNSNISNIMVVVLSFATAMVISILGFLFCKFVFYRNSDK